MSGKWVAAMVFGGVCILWMIWAVLAWGAAPDYNQVLTTEQLQNALSQNGIKACTVSGFTLENTPGFVEGKRLTVSNNCASDKNPLKVSAIKFDSEASRDAAYQRASTIHRNGFGPHAVYMYGPYVLTVQGTRGIADQLVLQRIVEEANANL